MCKTAEIADSHPKSLSFVCSSCRVSKPKSGFWKDKTKPMGYSYRCSDCSARRPGYAVEYYSKNASRISVSGREYYLKNKSLVSESHRRWKVLNKLLVRAYQQRRRVKMMGEVAEKIDNWSVFVRDNWTCGICGLLIHESDAQLDHLVSVNSGGSHTESNVQAAHGYCNASVGSKQKEKQNASDWSWVYEMYINDFSAQSGFGF